MTLGLFLLGVAGDLLWSVDRRSSFTTRDPAGVEVVVNRSPAWTAADAWAVDPEPILQIGAVEGAEPFLFQDIGGATRLADGRIVVLERGLSEIRVFDADGAHVTSFGRAGDGPGEFGATPDWTLTRGDTVLAFDGARLRYSWFTLGGELAREWQVDRLQAARTMRSLGTGERVLFPDGSMLRVATRSSNAPVIGSGAAFARAGLAGSTRNRTDMQLAMVGGLGERSADIGTFPGTESITVRVSDGRPGIRVYNPYHAAAHYAVDVPAGLVHIATPGQREIRSYGEDGSLERIVRQDTPLHPVTDDLFQGIVTALERALTERSFGATDAATMLGLMSLPDSVFPYSGLEVDTGGNLWIEDHYRHHEGEPETYQVFDADGVWLGPVTMPPGVGEILERGEDYLITEWLDELDVPYLRVYRIEKPRAP